MRLLSRRQWATLLAPLASLLRALPLSEFRLGITTDEIDDDPLAAAHFLRRYGLRWAEVRNIWGPYNTGQPLEKVRQARAIFDEQGVRVSVLDTGFFKIPLPPDTPAGRRKLDEQWKLLDAAMERAAVFGTRKIRIFTFMLEGDEKQSARSYGRIDELLREAARRARPGGFLLAVEDIGGGHVSNAAESAELLKRRPDLGSQQCRRIGRATVSCRLPPARPIAYFSRSSSRLPPRFSRKSRMDRCRPGRIRQSGTNPCAAQGRLQGDVHA